MATKYSNSNSQRNLVKHVEAKHKTQKNRARKSKPEMRYKAKVEEPKRIRNEVHFGGKVAEKLKI